VIDYQIPVIWKIVGLVYNAYRRIECQQGKMKLVVFNCQRNILVEKIIIKRTSRQTSILWYMWKLEIERWGKRKKNWIPHAIGDQRLRWLGYHGEIHKVKEI
jgi:hypothetical protein